MMQTTLHVDGSRMFLALQKHALTALSAVSSVIWTFSRAAEFARQCEDEFNRHGNISKDAMKRISALME